MATTKLAVDSFKGGYAVRDRAKTVIDERAGLFAQQGEVVTRTATKEAADEFVARHKNGGDAA